MTQPDNGSNREATVQKCPVCDGTGLVGRPPWVAGDQQEWVSTSAGPWPCRSCFGGLIYVY